MLNLLQSLLDDQYIKKLHNVQTLWSGYGEIGRYFSPRLNSSIIVKHVSPPEEVHHPKGWNTQTSHRRKLQSYQVEANFYQQHAKLCDRFCKVPKLIAKHTEGNEWILVLEDLDQVGFSQRKKEGKLVDLYKGIRWLAYFHARFMHNDGTDLWPIGTYWHLGTRQDEYQAMESGCLKDCAQLIDKTLSQGRYQTLVHGDAKLANFCFPDDIQLTTVAAVDFQYVGRGTGVKDLAYFLGACLDQHSLFDTENMLLDEYFSQLQKAIEHYQIEVDFINLEQEWRALYPLAWADFYRFLLGWSPGHYKVNPYMQKQTELAFKRIK